MENGHYDSGKCLYIFTIPKAGTYLLAALLEEFGIENSGYHISFNSVLDTLSHAPEANRQKPSTTSVKQPYLKSFRECKGKIAFGHLSPAFLPPGLLSNTIVIASFRNPYEVLISEFNDFRYIRHDVKFCSREVINNDQQAFTIYLERHASIIRDIMVEMARYLELFTHRIYSLKYRSNLPVVINYNELRSSSYKERMDIHFKKLFPGSSTSFSRALDSVYSQETKTKSTGYSFDPSELWSRSNKAIVRAMKLDQIHSYIIRQENILSSALH